MLIGLLRRPLDVVYLLLCAPVVLALVYILPPFQAPDEAAHFYRSIQISHGEIAPILAPKTYRSGAGGAVERSAYQLVDHYCGIPNWHCALQKRPRLADMMTTQPADRAVVARQVTAFSNTVVYLPVAHAVPAAAIAIARVLGLSALDWLYMGRLANGLFAITASWLALRLLRAHPAAPLIFAIATLPMTISLSPTLCADSGVISCSLVLLALCVRLGDECANDWWLWPVLVVAVFYAALAKLAYLPLVFMPVGCAVAAKCGRPVLLRTGIISIFGICVAIAWYAIIHAYVFPIAPDLRVDPARQLANVRHHPAAFLAVLVRSMALEAPRAALMLIGWKLSARNVLLPWVLVMLPTLTLALAAATSGSQAPRMAIRMLALLVIATGACGTFAFLYIQNSVVGGTRVEGYQGRYLLPLLPFVALVLPTFRLWSPADQRRHRLFVAAGGSLASVGLGLFLTLRTWG